MVEPAAAVRAAMPDVSPDRITAVRWLVIVALVACGGRRERPAEHVPAEYHDVAASAGHLAHVGKVACAECHGERGFAKPPTELCAQCHAKTTPLHHDAGPTCQDCHAFGAA